MISGISSQSGLISLLSKTSKTKSPDVSNLLGSLVTKVDPSQFVQDKKPTEGPSQFDFREAVSVAEEDLVKVRDLLEEQKIYVDLLSSNQLTDEDRDLVKQVVGEINDDIDAVVKSSTFEDRSLLTGAFSLSSFGRLGAPAQNLDSFLSKDLGLRDLDLESASSAANALLDIDEVIAQVDEGFKKLDQSRAIDVAADIKDLQSELLQARLNSLPRSGGALNFLE